jgi:tripartite ATP-independent transporter DctM subunit
VSAYLYALDKRSLAITRRVAFAGVVAMLAVAFITTADVLLRWLANSPILGLNEMVGMGMAVAVAATFPAGAAQRVNLTIDLLQNRVGDRTLAWLKVAGSVTLLVFYVLLAWRIGGYALKLELRGAETIFVKLPTAPFVWAIAAFVAISALVQIIAVFVAVSFALAGTQNTSGWSLVATADQMSSADRVANADSRAVLAAGTLVIVAAAVVVFGIYFSLDALTASAHGHPALFTGIIIALLWVTLLLYVPLAVVMGLLGLITAIAFLGLDPALSVLGNESVQFLTNPAVAILPLFLMMGSFAVVAGMSSDIYELAHKLLSHRRGGLALATIGGCAGFGALTGSSLATVATIGRVALPEMAARGYGKGLAAGTVAAGGTLGALVPPSIPLIFYALLTESSIGRLFIAAVIPAAIAVLFYLVAISIYVRINPGVAPVEKQRADWTEILHALRRAWAAILLLTVVVGAIYTGICTETEAAALGAGGAFIAALARGKMTRVTLFQVMGETTATTALIYLIIIGVLTFSFSMGVTGMPQEITEYVGNLHLGPVIIIGAILLIYLALGAIMDSNTVMFVTIPIVTPLISGMGYDLVWWGIINLVVLETGLITPPFGIHLFVLKSIAGSDVPLGTVYRGVLPFVCADLAKLALLVLFPALALWLPSTMRN